MEKGFTLIELLAVIIIVGVISTIAFMTVDKSVKDSKDNLYQVQVNTIYDGTETWVVDNLTILNEKQSCYVTLGKLQDGGYVEEGIINPKEDDQFSKDLKIVITNTISGYSYSIMETTEVQGCI